MLEPGDIVDRFQVVELLGAGGIAQVYKARHRVLGSLHALKVVTAGGPSVARRLLREGSIQAQLRHPNVVAVTDVIEVRGHTALVLEYVEGVTLQGYLAQRGVLPLDEALPLFAQVLAGVAAAHLAGVLHRDLKPANVLLTPGPAGVIAKVADFGLAKVLLDDAAPQAGDTVQGLVMGTPGYMAPEQVGEAGSADARADVFALGVVLYEVLGGEQPFTGDTVATTLRRTLRGQYRSLRELRPGLTELAYLTVEGCLAPDRADRFADARELARALYGDRPELAEVVEGSRPAAPLALSLPSVMPLRAGGIGSAASTPANPTLGPTALAGSIEVEPSVIPGSSAAWGGGAAPATPPPGGQAPLDPPRGGGVGSGVATPGAAVSAAGGGVTFGPTSVAGTPATGASAAGLDPTASLEGARAATPPGGDPTSVRAEAERAEARVDTTRVDTNRAADASGRDRPGTPAPARPTPSRRWFLSGFGLFATLAVAILAVRASVTPDPERAAASSAPPTAARAEAPPAGPAAEAAEAGGAPEVSGTGPAPEALAGAAPAAAPPTGAPPAGAAPPATEAPAPGAPGGALARATTGPSAEGTPTGSAAGSAPAGTPTDTANTITAGMPAVASTSPPEPTTSGAGASASTVEPVVADAAEAAPVKTPAASAVPASRYAGTWQGTWGGRPFTLALTSPGAGRLDGRLDVLVGTAYRTIKLTGTVDAAGRFSLSETPGPGWWLDGTLSGTDIAGSIRNAEGKKPVAYTAKPR